METIGDDFKLLDCIIDLALTMKSQIDALFAKIRLRVTAMIRTRAQYDPESMLAQYKSQF